MWCIIYREFKHVHIAPGTKLFNGSQNFHHDIMANHQKSAKLIKQKKKKTMAIINRNKM